jgi:hypothetical protein
MTIFTIYIGAIMAGFFINVPCSCGGLIQSLTWGEHLLFNLFFIALAFIAIVLNRLIIEEQPIEGQNIQGLGLDISRAKPGDANT